jgi:hypothetical protein
MPCQRPREHVVESLTKATTIAEYPFDHFDFQGRVGASAGWGSIYLTRFFIESRALKFGVYRVAPVLAIS